MQSLNVKPLQQIEANYSTSCRNKIFAWLELMTEEMCLNLRNGTGLIKVNGLSSNERTNEHFCDWVESSEIMQTILFSFCRRLKINLMKWISKRLFEHAISVPIKTPNAVRQLPLLSTTITCILSLNCTVHCLRIFFN